ncbi:major facilitator superfamily MFS_1 [Stackebrandtia nassauensis DSM 44728]|uniref:Major facilitator superfamily MFS_1 n=1 Tax=Stackebrandtia nassauensis (strain DSM 44728 / CIP 108903 / NRRL B-16338 / NBRC 102104 / LLR-40K-21) TaxID=446470 RepID=D3PXV7_STANL|nr:major facilitator superfamily MFS_1 [Stackebrandtia nassauensis DSM 44728]
MMLWIYATSAHRVQWLGWVMVAQYLPRVLAGALLSRFADLPHRGRVMVICDLVRVVVTLALLVAMWQGDIVLALVLLAASSGIGTVFFSAQEASIPVLVDRDAITQANAVLQGTNQSVFAFAPAVAVFVYVLVGPYWAIAFDAATFAVSAVILLRLWRLETTADRGDASDVRETRSQRTANIWQGIVAAGFAAAAISLSAGINQTVMIAVLDRDLGGAATDIGWLSIANGIAQVSVLGLVVTFAARIRGSWLLLVSAAGMALGQFAVSQAGSLTVLIAAVVVTSLVNAPFNVATATLQQRSTGNRHRGRVLGRVTAVKAAMFVVGALGGGWLADLIGGRATLVVSALACLAALVAAIFLRTSHRVSEIDHDTPPAVSNSIPEAKLDRIGSLIGRAEDLADLLAVPGQERPVKPECFGRRVEAQRLPVVLTALFEAAQSGSGTVRVELGDHRQLPRPVRVHALTEQRLYLGCQQVPVIREQPRREVVAFHVAIGGVDGDRLAVEPSTGGKAGSERSSPQPHRLSAESDGLGGGTVPDVVPGIDRERAKLIEVQGVGGQVELISIMENCPQLLGLPLVNHVEFASQRTDDAAQVRGRGARRVVPQQIRQSANRYRCSTMECQCRDHGAPQPGPRRHHSHRTREVDFSENPNENFQLPFSVPADP